MSLSTKCAQACAPLLEQLGLLQPILMNYFGQNVRFHASSHDATLASFAMRAPSTSAASLAQAMLGGTRRARIAVPKPQSVLAITCAGPTESA
jgi:hypothetical protein